VVAGNNQQSPHGKQVVKRDSPKKPSSYIDVEHFIMLQQRELLKKLAQKPAEVCEAPLDVIDGYKFSFQPDPQI
jgi:hypothetical protein